VLIFEVPPIERSLALHQERKFLFSAFAELAISPETECTNVQADSPSVPIFFQQHSEGPSSMAFLTGADTGGRQADLSVGWICRKMRPIPRHGCAIVQINMA